MIDQAFDVDTAETIELEEIATLLATTQHAIERALPTQEG